MQQVIREVPYSKAGGILEGCYPQRNYGQMSLETVVYTYVFLNRELCPRVSLRAALSRGGRG